MLEDHTFYRRQGKRWLDASCAAILLLVAVLPMALVAIAVLLSSGTPVIFRQKRTGLGGRPFVIYKFRTMTEHAEGNRSITIAGDRRITACGSFLRRFKLDELPQLVNVLIGDMSLVGPRPEVPEHTDCLIGADRQILEVRPGITGPASVAFRNEEQLLGQQNNPVLYYRRVVYPAKVALNRNYLQKVDFCTDLWWITKTLVPSPTDTNFNAQLEAEEW